jgi:hypothetical protein
MLALPIGVGTDSYILHQAMAATEGAAVDGDREMERTVRRVDCTAIAEGLFGVVLVLFNENWISSEYGGEPTYRG